MTEQYAREEMLLGRPAMEALARAPPRPKPIRDPEKNR